jgi:TonB family protein
MLALALIVWLAASAPEASTRIPGTRFSLGMSETQLQDVGSFTVVTVPDAAGALARQGEAKFFGVSCQTTLYFRDGLLARAHFEAKAVSPHSVDYVEDQLRREKMFRECAHLEPLDHVCDWLGDVKIHLETRNNGLDARVEMPPRPWETEADSARVAPETATPVKAAPAPTTPTGPAATAAHETPAPSTPAIATPAPQVHAPAPSSSPNPPAAAAAPVPTLPETLRISLPERNAAGEWPRMTTVPKLDYPEAARKESVQGIVWVMALVDTDGTVRSASIDRGIRELNDAAIAWATKARFAPCVQDGRGCRFWIRVAARFTLY